MAGTAPNIILIKGTYYVRVVVPKECRQQIGKGELWETLRTSNFHDAKKAAPPVIDKFKRMITAARRGTFGQVETMPARMALANWATKQTQNPPVNGGAVHTDWETTQRIQMLERAWNDPNGYLEIDHFDENLAAILTENGCRAAADDPIIAPMRQEAALTLLYAARYAEQARLANAFLERADAVVRAPVETIAAPSKPVVERPAPSLTIQTLFDEWMLNLKPADKERGRLNHQIRRLIETVGDIPANYLGH